ncbi:hypothetical protein DCS_07479 [Drechmeria coniospora]|uniref:Uncharacterized protein n=1 Tax=Drechmeria coniospora TaxID=98403 RepID=A0A151GEK6_DRECN|nr:hypothetical protein DCS_07479 [Drechmeria coniospora]KYK55516.1 hypothetical protein DCS_07479 [Drechmeria coniospora]
MCTYARTVFECMHQAWGRRLKLCAVGDDFRAGRLPRDCAHRKPHGLQSRRVSRPCDRCRLLDHKVRLVRSKLAECHEAFGKKWPDYRRAESTEPGTTFAETTRSELKSKEMEPAPTDGGDGVPKSQPRVHHDGMDRREVGEHAKAVIADKMDRSSVVRSNGQENGEKKKRQDARSSLPLPAPKVACSRIARAQSRTYKMAIH